MTFTSGSWTVLSAIEQSIKQKIEKAGKPLKEWDINIYRGILTGYNEAFIIDTETRDRLVAASPKSAEIIRPYKYNFSGDMESFLYPVLQLIACNICPNVL